MGLEVEVKKDESFTVECNVCGQRYDNWAGSTPCCGSIAYIVDRDDKQVVLNVITKG